MERGLFVFNVHGKAGSSLVGIITNCEHESGGATVLTESRLQKEGIGKGVDVVFTKAFFVKTVGFSSEGGLGADKVGALKDETVGRDGLSLINEDDVANDELLRVSHGPLVVSSDTRLTHVRLSHKLLEFLLLGIVVEDSDQHDNDDGKKNSKAFLEAVGPAVLHDSENGGDDSSDTEDLKDKVLEDFADHIAHGADFSLETLVLAVCLVSHLDVFWAAFDATDDVGVDTVHDLVRVVHTLDHADRLGRSGIALAAVVHVLGNKELHELFASDKEAVGDELFLELGFLCIFLIYHLFSFLLVSD